MTTEQETRTMDEPMTHEERDEYARLYRLLFFGAPSYSTDIRTPDGGRIYVRAGRKATKTLHAWIRGMFREHPESEAAR